MYHEPTLPQDGSCQDGNAILAHRPEFVERVVFPKGSQLLAVNSGLRIPSAVRRDATWGRPILSPVFGERVAD